MPVIAGILALSACAAPPPPVPPPGFAQHVLTRDAADVTTITHRGGTARVTAPGTNVGANSRTIFHRTGDPVSHDHTSCVTARHSGLPVQEGVALRVRTRDGRTRALTAMKNIWANVDWMYNVHTWDTARSKPYEQVSGHDMAAALRVGTGPRRLCARVVGEVLQFKVWRTSIAEPSWSDPVHTRSVRLPKGWTDAGRPGWYIGHVPPGGWAELDLSVPTPPPPTQPTTTTTTTTTAPPPEGAGDDGAV